MGQTFKSLLVLTLRKEFILILILLNCRRNSVKCWFAINCQSRGIYLTEMLGKK